MEGGGDVLDGNVTRGPEKRDKTVGGEWTRAYCTKPSTTGINWREQEGHMKKESNAVLQHMV